MKRCSRKNMGGKVDKIWKNSLWDSCPFPSLLLPLLPYTLLCFMEIISSSLYYKKKIMNNPHKFVIFSPLHHQPPTYQVGVFYPPRSIKNLFFHLCFLTKQNFLHCFRADIKEEKKPRNVILFINVLKILWI